MLEGARPIDEDDLPAGTCVGDYVVTGRLGEGGMATVYAADHPLIGRKVAIKVIRADLGASREAFERFLQEARAVIAIAHPNIVDVFTFGKLDDGRSFFVMELLEGRTLADALDLDGPLPLAVACDAIVEMCDGLEAAHRAGVVHRDLKPQNVFLVAPHGRVKLLDFGIAKLIRKLPEKNTPQTRPGMTIGTPDYLSPEQARGREVDPRSDVYSLGVVTYEMLTGQLPFIADNPADMMAMHLGARPEPPSAVRPTLPPAVDALILRMLAKDPGERPTLAEVRAECLSIKERPFAAPAHPVSRELSAVIAAEKLEAPSPRHVRRLAVAAAGVAAVAMCGALVGRGQSLMPAVVALAATPMPIAAPAEPAIAPLKPVPMPVLQPPTFGVLVVHAHGVAVTLSVDGKATPLDEKGVWRAQVTGVHHIAASAPGFRSETYEVQVDPGRVVDVPVVLQPLGRKKAHESAVAKSAPPDDFHTIDPWRKR